ncbi:DUF2282 domain-containing protein [Rhodospirillum sp. A1_3_36]|uniref:BufA1 family periplasmic bufferin-type metallophore n=1 Tax=Rhodospirillum sp. A1_3_36 TaxID=3391666 RepID=UPI0039A620FD
MKDTLKSKSTLAVATAMAFAIGAASLVPAAQAADTEKCFGVAKAEKNDCKTASNVCAGHSKVDGAKSAFILVPAGTCDKLVGGSLESM